MLDLIKDLIQGLYAEYKRSNGWYETFRRHCRKYKEFKDFLYLAYNDKKNGYRVSHSGAATTVRKYQSLRFVAPGLILWGIFRPDMFVLIGGLVALACFLPTRSAYRKILRELSEIATRAMRIYAEGLLNDGSNARERYAAATEAITSGDIVNQLRDEREAMKKEREKKSEEDRLRQLIELIKGESNSSTPPSPQSSSTPPTPTQPTHVVIPVPPVKRK